MRLVYPSVPNHGNQYSELALPRTGDLRTCRLKNFLEIRTCQARLSANKNVASFFFNRLLILNFVRERERERKRERENHAAVCMYNNEQHTLRARG